MAVLHKKEEKIQAVLGRLPKKYTDDEFIAMFIKLYSKDWGKIKSAYIKQSQDKEPGTVINMPKPDLYLKQVLEIYLRQNSNPVEEVKAAKVITTTKKPIAKKAVATAEKIDEAIAAPKTTAKKASTSAKKPVEAKLTSVATVKKPAPKKKAVAENIDEAITAPKTIAKKASAASKVSTKATKPKVAKK